MEENVVIIGGGMAGLSAAIYSARANLHPLVFAGSPPGGQLTLTTEVENFPGYSSILGPELVEKLRSQAKKFGAKIIDENVVKVDFSKKPLTIFQSSNSSPIFSKSVIIATGAKALWLGLPSEARLRGKGVSACATCDGFFFREKTVAVIGGGDTACEEALTLTKFAKKVYLIHRRDQLRASKIMQERVFKNEKIEVIWNRVVEEIVGENKVEGLRLRLIKSDSNEPDLINLPVEGVFVAIGHKPDTEIFKDQIALDEKGYIITYERAAVDGLNIEGLNFETKDYRTTTTRKGVFAAGDCVDYQFRQAITAAGMGVEAALEVERFLS